MIGVTSQQVPLNNGWPQKVLLHRCCGAASWGNFNKGRDGRHVTACRATCWLSQRWWWWGCIHGGFDDFDDFNDTLNQGKGWDWEPRSLLGERLRHQHWWHSWLAGILEPTWQSCKFTQLTKYNGEHQNTTRKRVFFCRTFQILIYFQFQALACTQPVLYSRTEKILFQRELCPGWEWRL